MTWSSKIFAYCHLGQQAFTRPAGRSRYFWSDPRGLSSVQFALVLPALLAVILGTIDMGRMMMTQNTLVHAANEATRYAMVRSESSDHVTSIDEVKALAKGRMSGLDTSLAVVNVNWIPANQPGARVTVDIDYPYVLSGLGTVNLKGSSSNFVTH